MALGAALVAVSLLAGGYPRETVLGLLALGVSGLLLLAGTRGLTRPSATVLLLSLLAAWTGASALWGADDALWAAGLPALYAAAIWLAEQSDPRALLRAVRLALLCIGALALGAWSLGLAPTAGASSHRLEWPVTYSNGLGLVAATGVLLWLGAPTRPWAAWLGAAVCALTLVLTFSRSALAGLVVGLALLWALRRGIRARWIALAAAAALLLCGPFLWHGFSRPAPDPRNAGRIVSLSGHGRTALWRAAWREGRSHPVWGVGAWSYRGPGGARIAHSLELQTFAELGLVGLLLVVAFVTSGAARARRVPVAGAVFATWLVVSAVDWDWQLPAATLPALLVLAASARPATLRR